MLQQFISGSLCFLKNMLTSVVRGLMALENEGDTFAT
jgi:hypothetical protein